MNASIPEPHAEARIHVFFDPSRGWCAMWTALDGHVCRRALLDSEVELLNRPYLALARYPSYPYQDPEEGVVQEVLHEDEYNMMIMDQLAPNMIAAIERLHFDLAAQFDPLTEDMDTGSLTTILEAGGQFTLNTARNFCVITDPLCIGSYLRCPNPQSIKIISGSTLISDDVKAKCLFHAVSMLAMVTGEKGGYFTNGRMDCRVPSPAGRRIAYVPADGCHPVHQYHRHAAAQRAIFEGKQYLVPTPTLLEMNDVYVSKFGKTFFEGESEHLTEDGQTWLIWALWKWAEACEVRLVLCIGLDAPDPVKEYTLQDRAIAFRYYATPGCINSLG